ncbi:DUF6507 family protein [Streptomyces sp. NPDC059072]|uniref:DUF6507 family protein n=1 Tax=Streptomyces sp. NPDC059072 TaxID=3346715 RepID=UPI00369E6FA6
MTSWDIKPQGVQGQLKTVGGHAGDLEKALNTLLEDMSLAAQFAGTAIMGSQSKVVGPLAPGQARNAMGPVAAALGQYLNGRKPELKSMTERIEACMRGAATATNEYLEGDLDQAKAAQDAARSVNLQYLREHSGEQK